MRRDMMHDMAEMLEATGVKRSAPTIGILSGMGSTRWGRADGSGSQTSVLNAHNRCGTPRTCSHGRLLHDIDGVPQPVAHLYALTARAADFAVRELTRNNL